jgi:hypothetical protein
MFSVMWFWTIALFKYLEVSPGKGVIAQSTPWLGLIKPRSLLYKATKNLKWAPAAPCQSCQSLLGLQNELRSLPEPRFTHGENYYRQGPNNQKFDTKSTLTKKPVPSGVAMSKLSNGTKKDTSKSMNNEQWTIFISAPNCVQHKDKFDECHHCYIVTTCG